MSKTATDVLKDEAEAHRDERILHARMEWFTKKYQPADRREAAEFQADLLMLVQAVHQDASRHTHKLLENALRVMPPFTGSFVVEKPK